MAIVDYQLQAREFEVNDLVYPFMSGNRDLIGRVVAVYPAIGMVQVQWPHGSERIPVEDLQRYESDNYLPPAIENANVPGGRDTVPVSSGTGRTASISTARISEAFVKKAVYWAAVNRKYKASQEECESGQFHCPRCPEQMLVKAIYRRQDGMSDHLLGCPHCMFLVRREDIMGHPDYDEANPHEPFAALKVRSKGKKAASWSVLIRRFRDGINTWIITYDGDRYIRATVTYGGNAGKSSMVFSIPEIVSGAANKGLPKALIDLIRSALKKKGLVM